MRITKAPGIVTAIVLLASSYASTAQGFKLTADCLVSFATTEAGTEILTNRDDFITVLSPFDRAARMKTNREVAEKEFLAFLGRNSFSWAPAETNRVMSALQSLQKRIVAWKLPLPPNILLIKTTGREEGNACYTRQNAIIFAQKEIVGSRHLESMLAHELFHILSRHNPALRTRLYQILGFSPIDEIQYPPQLRSRKITNPDGVQNRWAINITNQNQALTAVPILYASTTPYDPNTGGEFFDYLVFRLLAVTNRGGHWQPQLAVNQPQLLDPKDVQGFFEQVGRNTGYIIHPDEILADNFVHMINGETNLPTPRIVAEMRTLFLGH